MIGGPGKDVEIDKMFLCHRKYKRGRKMAKEGTWILGLTEVEASTHPIENPEHLEQLKDREDKRELAVLERSEKRKRAAERRIRSGPSEFPSAVSAQSPSMSRTAQSRVSLPPQHRDINLDRRALQNDDPVDFIHVGDDANESTEALGRADSRTRCAAYSLNLEKTSQRSASSLSFRIEKKRNT